MKLNLIPTLLACAASLMLSSAVQADDSTPAPSAAPSCSPGGHHCHHHKHKHHGDDWDASASPSPANK